MNLIYGICMRCGAPIGEIPAHVKDRVSNCRYCRSPEENKQRELRIAAYKKWRKEKDEKISR